VTPPRAARLAPGLPFLPLMLFSVYAAAGAPHTRVVPAPQRPRVAHRAAGVATWPGAGMLWCWGLSLRLLLDAARADGDGEGEGRETEQEKTRKKKKGKNKKA
jgi:hypothetical protein